MCRKDKGSLYLLIHLFYPSFFSTLYPSFLLPSHSSSLHDICFFQRQKQSFLFNQKERAGSHYFEENMKDWCSYSMLILAWTLAKAALYSLSVLCLCAHACMLVLVSSSTAFVHAVLIDGYWIGYYSFDFDIMQERWSIIQYFLRRKKNWILSSADSISVNGMYCLYIPEPVMVLVNTGYALSCISLPRSSVTQLTALSACSARWESPAGLH